jgi:hypothetical protein
MAVAPYYGLETDRYETRSGSAVPYANNIYAADLHGAATHGVERARPLLRPASTLNGECSQFRSKPTSRFRGSLSRPLDPIFNMDRAKLTRELRPANLQV